MMKKGKKIKVLLLIFVLLIPVLMKAAERRILWNTRSFSAYISNYYQTSIVVEKFKVRHFFERYTDVEYVAYTSQYPENKWIDSMQIDWQDKSLYQPREYLKDHLLNPAACVQQAESLTVKVRPEIQSIFSDYALKLYVQPIYCDHFEDLFQDTKFECCMKIYIALENAHFFSDESFASEMKQFKEWIEWGKETNNRQKIIVDYVIYSVDELDRIQNDYFLMLKTYENTAYKAFYDIADLGFIDFEVSRVLKP